MKGERDKIFPENWQPFPKESPEDLKREITGNGVCLKLDQAGKIELYDLRTGEQLQIMNMPRKDGTFFVRMTFGDRYQYWTQAQDVWSVQIDFEQSGDSEVVSLSILGSSPQRGQRSSSLDGRLNSRLSDSLKKSAKMINAGLVIVQLGYKEAWKTDKWLEGISQPVFSGAHASLFDEEVAMTLVEDLMVANLKLTDLEEALKTTVYSFERQETTVRPSVPREELTLGVEPAPGLPMTTGVEIRPTISASLFRATVVIKNPSQFPH